MTVRDAVWTEVLDTLIKYGKFKISDLDFPKSKRHTVRRVLRQMEEYDWLMRESKRDSTWRVGPRAESHLNISSEKIRSAKE